MVFDASNIYRILVIITLVSITTIIVTTSVVTTILLEMKIIMMIVTSVVTTILLEMKNNINSASVIIILVRVKIIISSMIFLLRNRD